jgi:hypothetical protein
VTVPQTPGVPDHAAPRGRIAWLNYAEPARLRAVAAALVALAAALGLTLPFDLPGIIEAAIPLLAFLVPLLQGEATRAAVVSPRRADLIAAGRAGTGLSDGPHD